MKIVRAKTKVSGGITPDEKARMDEHAALWTKRAMRTTPIEPGEIVPAIEGIYAAAGLKKPRVVIAPSPLVMAFAYGSAAAIWANRFKKTLTRAATRAETDAATRAETDAATDAATRAATYVATDAATRAETDAATDAATRAATRAVAYAATRAAAYAATDAATRAATRAETDAATYVATDAATRAATRAATDAATDAAGMAALACEHAAGRFGLECAKRWSSVYQGGNMWAGYDCYLTSFRDILGLELKEHEAYAHWERAAIHGGFRVMHEEFCIVSDFPEVLRIDDQNRPHCENGPSHRWRDGWSLYHWHGVKVPAHWIEDRANLDPNEVIKVENTEQRAAGAAICGWPKMLSVLKSKTIDKHENPEIGELIELKLPGLSEPGRFLKAVCPRNGIIVEGVPHISDIDGLPITTAIAAQAWRLGDPQSEFIPPPKRT